MSEPYSTRPRQVGPSLPSPLQRRPAQRAPRSARALARLLVLGGLLAGSVALVVAPASGQGLDTPRAEFGIDNPIVRENAQPGDLNWQLPSAPRVESKVSTADQPDATHEGIARWDPPPISGYADRTSVAPGEVIRFYVSTTAPLYDLNISRMGWYGGKGGRTVHTVYGLPGVWQPVPAPDPDTGLIVADWQPSYSLTIPLGWPSGVYLVRLLATNEYLDAAYIMFVVRDDNQVADFVYKVAVNTYQAYNNWGGKSLYAYNSVGPPATKVSYDRPYSQWQGAGHFFDWDYPMIRWLEREGYNVTYITDIDAHTDRAYQRSRRALLSVGHDEYWTWEMRAAWEAARDANRSLGFFGGDTIYWQVRLEPSARGVPNRVLVCYRDPALDPLAGIDDQRVTVRWRDAPLGRPENALVGVLFDNAIPWEEDFPYVVKAADHWIFDGTDARPGDAWSRIVGYEYDLAYNNGHSPPNLVVLSESPVVGANGRPSVSHSTYYRQGGMVFAAGTIDWAWALDDFRQQWGGTPSRVDSRLQRVTANVLRAFRQGGPPVRPSTPREEGSPGWWLAGLALSAAAVLGGGTAWLLLRRRSPQYDPWPE
jgi:hypothetical protein